MRKAIIIYIRIYYTISYVCYAMINIGKLFKQSIYITV